MKSRLLTLAIICPLLISITVFALELEQKFKLNYNIAGVWQGGDGETVYLVKNISETKVRQKIDSAVVENGKFSFNKNLPFVAEVDVVTAYGKEAILLCDNALLVTITTRVLDGRRGPQRVASFKFTGDDEQSHYQMLKVGERIGSMSNLALLFGLSKAQEAGDKEMEDSVMIQYKMLDGRSKEIIDSVITNYPDSYTAAMGIMNIYGKDKKYPELLGYYEKLSKRVKRSVVGRELKEAIDEVGRLGIGQVAPDFTASTPDGKPIKLSSLRGKCVLIDFWASWCGPCRAEFPNVKSVYDEFKGKGFEILSISLDDDKAKWVKSITDNNLDWIHISTLKGWSCPIGKQYKVTGVPTMMLLDRDGCIVTKDLRGDKLRIEVEKLINRK